MGIESIGGGFDPSMISADIGGALDTSGLDGIVGGLDTSLGIGGNAPDGLRDAGEFARLATPEKIDDTWFTKDRMDAIQKAGDKATTSMQDEMSALGEPKFQDIKAPGMPQLQLQTKHAGLTQPLRTFRDGGAMARMGGPGCYANGGGIGHVRMAATINNLKGRLAGARPQHQGHLRPGMQTGPGTGGSDSIQATLKNGGDVRVGNQEYVVPADVVSAIGDGSSEAGSKILKAFCEHVRQQYRHKLGRLPGPK